MKHLLLITILLLIALPGFAFKEVPQQKDKDIKQILDKIANRLNTLEADYLSELNKTDRREAGAIVNEIRGLLSLLPQHVEPRTPRHRQQVRHKEMSVKNFEALQKSVKNTVSAKDKLNVLTLAATDNWFSVDQIIQLLGLFMNSSDKLKALEIVYPRCVDPSNRFNILDSFMSGSDKEKATKIMTGKASG